METIWSITADSILSTGRALMAIGVHNWALTKEQALIAADLLAAEGIAILGGDVYEVVCDVIQPTYDNWYCERLSGESEATFVERCLLKTRSYIAGYEAKGRTILFAIVPQV